MSTAAVDFILELARHTQLLACLKWLSDFQVLAFIPVGENVAFSHAANLASVPTAELCRVVRMTATAGILCESKPGFVAHSPLSAHFVAKPSLLDAAAFLAENAAPAALHLANATRLRSEEPSPEHGQMPKPPAGSFATRCAQEPQLRRDLTAFQRLGSYLVEKGTLHVLSSLDWQGFGAVRVVEVGAQSTATAVALCDGRSGLSFTVQPRDERCHINGVSMSAETMKRITVRPRAPGSPQMRDADVYILHAPSPSLSDLSTSLLAQITAELRVHFNILRAANHVRLVLVARVLPEPGAADTDVEALGRMDDLWLLEMANDQAWKAPQLLELLESVRDNSGRLVVLNKISSRRHLTVAFEVQYRPWSDQRSHNVVAESGFVVNRDWS